MKTQLTILLLFLGLFGFISSYGNGLHDNFEVQTERAELYERTSSALKFESDSPTYMVKLEPNIEGAIMFAIGRHGYLTTARVKNLFFGVLIEGFKFGEVVAPIFNLDDSYKTVGVDGNFLVFKSNNQPISITFNTAVDSIKLHFSNSHGLNVQQFLTIEGLQVIDEVENLANPALTNCDQRSIMIGVDGSSSIDKKERKIIAKQFRELFKKTYIDLDSNLISLMEFGKEVYSISEAMEKKVIVKNFKEYQKNKNKANRKTSYTNWEAAFEKAIERSPDVFVFVTDRWSNYGENGPASFNEQFRRLVIKCRKLKANGTRLLFITSGLNGDYRGNYALYAMLSQYDTNELQDDKIFAADLKTVDLVSLEDFTAFNHLDLSSLLECHIQDVGDEPLADVTSSSID